MLKRLDKPEIERTRVNMVKITYDKLTANIMLKGEGQSLSTTRIKPLPSLRQFPSAPQQSNQNSSQVCLELPVQMSSQETLTSTRGPAPSAQPELGALARAEQAD